MQIVKAESLSDMLKTFRAEPLDESVFAKFYYNNTMSIRTGNKYDSPVEDLFEDCTTSLAKNAHLLMGHGGSGKSTELFNLKKRFEQAGQPVTIINFATEADIYKASRWDIMLMITEGLCAIAKENNINVPKKTIVSVMNYIHKDEVRTDDTSILAELGVEGGLEAKTPAILEALLKLFISVKSGIKASSTARTTITEKMEKRAPEWIGYIEEISDHVSAGLNGKQPILIFENLDKIQPPEKALDILLYPYLAEVPFPIIYTFPISLYYDPRITQIKNNYRCNILPMIKVSNSDGSPNEKGIEVIREIVKLRADENLFDNDVLEKLIKQTGGVLRHLFSCIISAARLANRRGSDIIEEDDAIRALSDLGEELSRLVYMPDHEQLKRIYCDKRFREQIDDLRFLLTKLQALVVLEYKNSVRWHDLHPIVATWLMDQNVITKEDYLIRKKGADSDAG